MPSPNIHVTTSVDTTGLRPLEDTLQRYKELSDEIAKNFSAFRPPNWGGAGGSTPPPGPGNSPPSAPPPGAGTPPPPGQEQAPNPNPGASTTGSASPPGADPMSQKMADLIPHLDRLATALERIPTSAGMGTTPPSGTTGGAGYNLNSISGLENWVQNVMAPATPVIDAMEAAGQGPVGSSTTASAATGHSATVAAAQQRVHQAMHEAQQATGPATPPPTNAAGGGIIGSMHPDFLVHGGAPTAQPGAGGSAQAAPSPVSKTAFDALYRLATEPGYVPETDPVFQAAQEATGWSATQVHQAASTIAEQTVQGATPAQIRTTLNGGGGSGTPPGGPPGSSSSPGPSGFGVEAASALGSLGAKYLPFLTMGGAALFGASQIEQGWGEWQQTGTPFSNLSKVTGDAGQALASFRDQILSAGTQFGYSLNELTGVATQLTQVMGTMSSGQLAATVGTVASFARGTGLTLSQSAQIFASAGQEGLISGTGAPLSNMGLTALLGSMAAQGGMIGRMGPMATGYLTAMQGVESNNVMPVGATGTAGILTAMSSTGIQGMQGTRGASLFETLNSGMMNNQGGFGQSLIFSALEQANPSLARNPMGLLSVQAGGLGSTIYGTHETVQTALTKYIHSQLTGSPAAYGSPSQNFFPKNANAGYESGLIMQTYGLGPSQVNLANAWGSFMNTHSSSQANAVTSLLSQSGTSLGKYQAGAVQYLGELGTVHTQAQFNQVLQRFIQNGGMDQISSHARMLLTAAIHSGHLGSETQALAAGMQDWTPMNIMDWQQAQAARLALTRSHVASWLTAGVGGIEGVFGHNPLTFGLSTIGAGTASYFGLKAGAKGIRGLFARLKGGSPAEVAQADAMDQAAQAAGETSTMAGSGVATGLDVGSGAMTGGANVVADTGSGALQIAGDMASRLPLIGAGVSMAMDVPHMLSQIQHGQAGKGIGGMVGTGAGAWGGFLGGAALAAPLDPFTFGLASLAGGALGAFAGSSLGRHLGSWLGGAVTGEKGVKQYGAIQVDQLQIQQLWIESIVGANSATAAMAANQTRLPSGSGSASVSPSASTSTGGLVNDLFGWTTHGMPSGFSTPSVVSSVTSPGGGVPSIGLTATEDQWLPDILKSLKGLPNKSSLLTPSLVMSVIADQSGGNPNAVGHDSNGTYDAGLMQVNSSNFSAYGLTPHDALNVMANLKAGETILNQDLQRTHSVAGGLYAYGGVGPQATQGMDAMLSVLKEISAAIKAQTKAMQAGSLSVGVGAAPTHHLLPKRGK